LKDFFKARDILEIPLNESCLTICVPRAFNPIEINESKEFVGYRKQQYIN
jgi:hypothetical protein